MLAVDRALVVAAVSFAVDVPSKTVVPTFMAPLQLLASCCCWRLWPCCCWLPAVTAFPAVDGIPAVAKVSAVAGNPAVAVVLLLL